ncbi:ATP-dependent DNA helicase RecG [Vagococcus xieshaowenii]|uniref:ATP-dependent DNA helicase RecG n=1 Tax=Vagococcus xieshaowenii TaxID=2562451 RepID=A0AAJ5EDU1_9ENTE|nr:ATP-dependent DNA helicase RecG [Vagococcus xieshaowenii]QCA28925.1 ATP-dependent DNA helicase RecG [Vagococcus xieshaowenii]TFZ39262.1 ATP-dependent DNA helicase RecG [Vagococcus xieshaowenii]
MKSLNDGVAVLAGVGPKKVEQLMSLGIETIEELIMYFPFRYNDFQLRQIEDIADQEKVVLKGTVVTEAVVSHFGYKKNRLMFNIRQEHVVVKVTFFNQHFLQKQVHMGEEISVYGKWDSKRQSLMGIKILSSGAKEQSVDEFAPIYHVNKQVRQQTLVDIIAKGIEAYLPLVEDWLPDELVEKYHFLDRQTAVKAMHFPQTMTENQEARRRMVFEEFFEFQMRMQQLKHQEKTTDMGTEILYDNARLKTFIETLPFELTSAQKRVTNEICRDMRSSLHMHRLLQGDVGSGKTVIAAIVLYAAVTAGFQGAMMVPTEILAEQHFLSLTELFKDTDVRVALLTGSTKAKEKREILAQLANHELDIIVGTHALIQDGVDYHHLGLVITDEQHRFGVKQRQALREKGNHPDVLFMTATPIPRTLAITAYGEMDVSVIDELPAGRIPITTRWVKPQQLKTVLDWSAKELRQGHQVYVICPLIEESESLDLKNATELYDTLRDYYAPDFEVGLLHGKMKPAEKDDIMTKFKDNELQILVSTTVIEVGVNVPNATIMMIMDAERFGLAQLHQLRGRVGRGSEASYCILVSNPKNDTGIERMKIMTETTDGFVLSQKDLEMRGPGEFFGARQSGIPQFNVGDMVVDFDILETARQEASNIWEQYEWQIKAAYQLLAQRMVEVEQTGKFD